MKKTAKIYVEIQTFFSIDHQNKMRNFFDML